MEMLRLYVSRSFALAAAIVLIAASVRAAQAGTEILNQMLSFDEPSAIAGLREVLLLAAIALATGMCAILIAPRAAVGKYKIAGGKIVHDIRQVDTRDGTARSSNDSSMLSVEMDTSMPAERLMPRAHMSASASASSPPREKVSPRGR